MRSIESTGYAKSPLQNQRDVSNFLHTEHARLKRLPYSSRRVRRCWEISYSSTLLLMWALFLAYLSFRAHFRMQAATILTLCSVALTSDHGESRLLMPLIFLSERCLDSAMNFGHSPPEFYASTLLAYLSLIVCKAEQRGQSARDRHVVLETTLYAAVGLSVVYFILKDAVISLGAVAYVGAGHIFFVKLLPVVGENEAVLVSSLVGFYMCDVCMNNNLSADGGRASILNLVAPGYLTSYTHIVSRGMMLCSIYLVVVISLLSKLCLVPVNRNSKSSECRVSRKGITAIFWVSAALIGLVLFCVISYQLQENVVMWLFGYLASSRFRTWTVVVWSLALPWSVVGVECFTRGVRPTVRRKIFHFIAVVAFTPAAMIDPPFLALALTTATSLFVVIEVARYYRVYGTQVISDFLAHHIDDRENINGVVRTHSYLLFGLGFSLMMRYRHKLFSDRSEPAIMELSINIIPGIISLGIVDASAATIGSSFLLSSRRTLGRYLTNYIFTERANISVTHKTTTGTIGGLICGLLFWYAILAIAEVPLRGPVWYTFTMIAVCSLTECFVDGIDNLQMPLVVLGAVYTLFALLMPIAELWQDPLVSRPNPTTARSMASALSSPWLNWPSTTSVN